MGDDWVSVVVIKGRRMNHVAGARVRRSVAGLVALVLVTLLVTATPWRYPTPAGAAAPFTAGGSINQVYTYGHAPGATVELRNSAGAVAATGVADEQGAKLFKEVAAGTGYRIVSGGQSSDGLTVTTPDDHPEQAFYDGITLGEGYGYLPTRDGTLLSVNVSFPADGSPGPWPVVVVYSGYDPSQPGGPPREAAFYPFAGYVTVGVNMRGTTCSGGAYDFFEPPQLTDGYDAIEALAAQPWANGDVGMVGISFSGFSQLYVASTRPPHLRAITPLSPYADTYRSILYPGGILNDGFALDWAAERQADSRPAAHQWVKDRIAGGDTTCADNQVLRLQSRDLLSEIRPGRFDAPQYDYLDSTTFADKINVPTYMAAQFQDEQTGGHSAELAPILAANTKFKVAFTNGTHVEPLGPSELPRVLEFVDFYVGKKRPRLPEILRLGLPPALRGLFEDPIILPPDRFTDETRFPTFASALASYEAEDPVRVRWENGGVAGLEGSPYSTYDSGHPAWPIPSVVPQRWYLQPDGVLGPDSPTVADAAARGASLYRYDPAAKRDSSFDGSTEAMWKRHPDVHWETSAEGTTLSYTTPAFTEKTAYAGTGSADLWLRSTAPDTDLEVTLVEVRPDGHEVFVQSGWLRASHRKLDPSRSTELTPYQTHLEGDAAPLPAGEFVPVRIEVFPFAHVVRPGSRLRLNVEAPGGNQPFWAFATLDGGYVINEIAHSAGHPSSLVLPLLRDERVPASTPAAAPSCEVAGVTTQAQSMRNQPCRPDHPARRPTEVSAAVSGDDVVVSWAPPPTWAGDAGGPVSAYRVTASPGGQSVQVGGSTTAATVSGLDPGTPYTFTVRARFGFALGPPSDASLPATIPTPTIAARFVRAAFADLYGHPPDAAALERWTRALGVGASRTEVATALMDTDEFRSVTVAAEYERILGRHPDPSGFDWWVAYLSEGASVDQLRAALAGSNEFWTKAGATPDGFADALYRALLERAPDVGGRAYLVARLAAGASRASIATWLVQSTEADRVVVRHWYQRFLGREPSPAESRYRVGRLQAGVTESTNIAQLMGSTEYLYRALAE
ncbi:MAG: CocE/NonD family hydrolase [Acidimicrobiales bacterium]